MKSKFSLVVILFVITSLALSTVVFAQGYSDPRKGIPKIPNVPKPLPNAQGLDNNTTSTLKTLDTINDLNNLQQTLDTIKSVEELEKIQNVGSMTVTLTNSEKYKELNVNVTAFLAEDDLDANVALFEKYLPIIKENIAAELAVLTDKELGWEQESGNVLKSVRKKVNTIARKEFLANLLYSEFELVKK